MQMLYVRDYVNLFASSAIPHNFTPCSTVPVLMINGRNDFRSPLKTEIEPMFALQGAPDEHKRLVVLVGGHVPEPPNEYIRKVIPSRPSGSIN